MNGKGHEGYLVVDVITLICGLFWGRIIVYKNVAATIS
jgi:hypothetical protein